MYCTVISDILFEAFQSTFAQPNSVGCAQRYYISQVWRAGSHLDLAVRKGGHDRMFDSAAMCSSFWTCWVSSFAHYFFALAFWETIFVDVILNAFETWDTAEYMSPISSRCGLWLWLCVYLTSSLPIV